MILVASPPPSAVGGVARHTEILLEELQQTRLFDEWWPCTSRPLSPATRSALHLMTLLRFLARLLASTGPTDSVHLQATDGGLARDVALAWISRLLRVPVVTHLHGSGFDRIFKATTNSRMAGRLLRLSSRIIVMSESARSAVIETYPAVRERVLVVPNPVPRLFCPGGSGGSQQGKLRLLCVGEISVRKGQMELARTVRDLATEGYSVNLALVGPWGDLDAADRWTIERNPHVSCRGILRGEDLAWAYTHADAFVLFSNAEAEPLSILEAMSFGLPVIATDTGSVSDLVLAVAGNKLLQVGDTSELRRVLADWCTRSVPLRDIGTANREFVREHRSVTAHTSRLQEIHHALHAR